MKIGTPKLDVPGTLYRLDFSSGKSYVGVTTRPVLARFRDHEDAAKKESSWFVYQAWKKYGKPKLVVLAFLEKHALKDAEQRAVRVFGTFGSGGYNMTPGGEIAPAKVPWVVEKMIASWTPERRKNAALRWKGKHHSQASIEKMSVSQLALNKKNSAETRAKTSASVKKYLSENVNPWLGKTHTNASKKKMHDAAISRAKEHNQKISETMRGRKLPEEVKSKMSKAHTGLKHSPEQTTAILLAVGRNVNGRFCSKEGGLS